MQLGIFRVYIERISDLPKQMLHKPPLKDPFPVARFWTVSNILRLTCPDNVGTYPVFFTIIHFLPDLAAVRGRRLLFLIDNNTGYSLPPRCNLLPCQIIRSSLQKWALCIVRVLPALCLRDSNTVDEGLRKL